MENLKHFIEQANAPDRLSDPITLKVLSYALCSGDDVCGIEYRFSSHHYAMSSSAFQELKDSVVRCSRGALCVTSSYELFCKGIMSVAHNPCAQAYDEQRVRETLSLIRSEKFPAIYR